MFHETHWSGTWQVRLQMVAYGSITVCPMAVLSTSCDLKKLCCRWKIHDSRNDVRGLFVWVKLIISKENYHAAVHCS